MTLLAIALLVGLGLIGLIMIPLGLPGLWVMVGGVLGYGWLTGFRTVGVATIAIALCLAFSETLGKSAQTSALNYQIEASNLWNFFQAKSIRRTNTLVAGAAAQIELATVSHPARKAAPAAKAPPRAVRRLC